ncbi:MAG: helicase HerA-like domain-containing protein [Acidimicrobiales bacterium]
MAPTDEREARPFAERISKAYATTGPAVLLGKGMIGGATDPGAAVQMPASMLNRHGLIAGATGTGKTKTLQLMAEQLSALGIAVFAADMKGDLAGLAQPGPADDDRVASRVAELQVEWTPAAVPVSFLALGGLGPGIPVRATVSAFGPRMLARVLDANETQASSLSLLFRYSDDHGLALLDLDDLREVLRFLTSDEGKADLEGLGGLSSATVGVLLREIVELEDQGGAAFFGEPELEVADLLRRTPDGRGIVSCLELASVQDKPKLFSTFLMWLLAELFHDLPEVGDLDQPKLVFFFDEAHLLFDDASEQFREQVAQTVRLIRSKGVGVFFITQLPDDVPDEVLAQLGNRVQHALRAFTPRDAKALRAAVSTYPTTDDYELDRALTELGTGEAMVTILSEGGAPTPVVWTKLRPPRSLMAAIGDPAVEAAARADELWPKYGEEIDRESAREKLGARMARSAEAGSKPKAEVDRPVLDYLKSREGRSMINTVARGVFGLLKRRR